MDARVPDSELEMRMRRFKTRMDRNHPGWEFAVIFGNLNLYYFTGTMQDSMLCIPGDGEPVLWVRKSYERARDESGFPRIMKMNSFRDAAREYPSLPQTVYLETEILPLALYQRFTRHFPIPGMFSLDRDIAMVRAVKSRYELSLMEESGRIHEHVLEQRVPEMLKEGMNEVDFAGELYRVLLEEGHHGITRFGMFNTEMLLGQMGFGVTTLYPTYFDGPGGSLGMCPAVPLLGNRKQKLREGDLVFVDIGVGVGGYHTDKTMTYMFKKPLPDSVIEEHNRCVDIQDTLARMLQPGVTPSSAYRTIMAGIDETFALNFMGYNERKVKFLGHGIGLQVDELPVIAEGFDDPFEENMVIALEPKKGIPGVGMIGIENTFVVTPAGGRCITGSSPGMMLVE
jgi:Xaa-Pro aminopeptidase